MRSATYPGQTRPAVRPKFRANKQTCIAMGGIIILMLAGTAGMYVWQTGEMNDLEGQIKLKQDEAATGQKTADTLEAVRADAAQVESKLRYLETSVTGSMYIPTLLKQVDNMARSMKLDVQGLRHSSERTPTAPPPDAPKEVKDAFKPLPYDLEHIEMDISGDYWTISRFIYKLTTFPKILSVESLSLSPNGPTPGVSPQLTVRLKMTGFVFKDTGESVAGESAKKPELGSARTLRAAENQILNENGAKKR